MNQIMKQWAIVSTDEINTYRVIGDGAATTPSECKYNAHILAAAPSMVNALRAIVARMQGDWNNPILLEYGLLGHNSKSDVLDIAESALKQIPGV